MKIIKKSKGKFKKPTFNLKKIEKIINNLFPNSKITSFKQFKQGLVSPTFKVKISNPKKNLVIKLSKLKNKVKIHKNNQTISYLSKHQIPTPKIFYEGIHDKKYITILEFLEGTNGFDFYNKASIKQKKTILKDSGINLRKIHSLKIPNFWKSTDHEIRTEKSWKRWTKLRISKYNSLIKKTLPQYEEFIKKELKEFYSILEKQKIKLSPLHWDYHLANLNVNEKGKIVGIFDFDNSMKGHNLADLGQTAYWLRFRMKAYDNFEVFLKGYHKKLTIIDKKLIRGYFLLHLLAVTRTLWHKQARLGWIIKEHKKILNDFVKGRI